MAEGGKYWNITTSVVEDGNSLKFVAIVNLLGQMSEVVDTLEWNIPIDEVAVEHKREMLEDQAVLHFAPMVQAHCDKMTSAAKEWLGGGTISSGPASSSPFTPELWSDELKKQYELALHKDRDHKLEIMKLEMEHKMLEQRQQELEFSKLQASTSNSWIPTSLGLGGLIGAIGGSKKDK